MQLLFIDTGDSVEYRLSCWVYTMVLRALSQTAWQHCMCPTEAIAPQTLLEDAQEAGTHADWHSLLRAYGSVVLGESITTHKYLLSAFTSE